jgi:hypothetical protein
VLGDVGELGVLLQERIGIEGLTSTQVFPAVASDEILVCRFSEMIVMDDVESLDLLKGSLGSKPAGMKEHGEVVGKAVGVEGRCTLVVESLKSAGHHVC